MSLTVWFVLLADDGTLIYKRRHSMPVSVDSDDQPSSTGPHSATGCQYVIIIDFTTWTNRHSLSS